MYGGGTERIALNLHENLPKEYNTSLLTLYNTNNEYYNITSPYLIKFRRNQFSRILLYPLATVRFICHCIHEKTNIVISMDDSTNLINLLSQAIGKKAIICFHVIPLLNPNIISWLNRKLLSFLIRITNPSVVVLHNRMKKEVCEAYHISNTDNVHVIHNPNQLSEIQKKSLEPSRLSWLNQQEIPTIITVGRLADVKAQWHLIRIFSKLHETMSCRLLVCGHGPEEEYLQSLSHELKVDEDIIFLGWQKNPHKFMARSTVFALTSISEALPNVLVESMAVGCPVVAANCSPGIEEIMGSDNTCGIISEKMSGTRYAPDEPLDEGEMDFLNNLKIILEDAKLRNRMSCKAKERAKLFDVDIGIQKYVELIENCVTWT